MQGCAMAHVVHHWPVTAEAQAQSQASPCRGVVNRMPSPCS